MRIALATDAWHPQVNGVVRALSMTAAQLRERGAQVEIISPDQFLTVACPTYPEIRLAIEPRRSVVGRFDQFAPEAVHVATEGPIGWAARAWCRRRRMPFTTSFHTRFPDYVSVRTRIPADWIWPVMRRFHGAAERTFAVTQSLARELEERRVGRPHHWPLGVDLSLFTTAADPHPALAGLERPIQLSVGRVAVEKNLECFLSSRLPGTKVIVGDGPAREMLEARFPDTVFLGALHGAELASAYAAADVFVFPSRTDTFGLVNIEALASGLPVAAFPVRGPLDIVGEAECGVHGRGRPIGALDENLEAAIARALNADRDDCRAEALHYDWARCTDRFVDGLAFDRGQFEVPAAA